jgi:hypothetical protein
MTAEHQIVINRGEMEPLTAKKFWRIGFYDEEKGQHQMEGKTITFRGEEWTIDMAGQQLSLNEGVAGVKMHPEPTQVEMIATIWGAQRVQVKTAEGNIRVDSMCGPLTEAESQEAEYFYVENPVGEPQLRISHRDKGVFEIPFSITMPGESHQTAYSREAGCIAIKMSRISA